jgi:hypothetical protein
MLAQILALALMVMATGLALSMPKAVRCQGIS